MGRVIQIEIPDWINPKDVENIKQILIEALEEKN